MTRSKATDIVGSTRAAIIRRLADGYSALPEVAADFGVSDRTLRRQLGRAGVSYRQLIDDIRLAAAKRWLADRHRSFAEVAALLGYADPANFTRAFLRWTGVGPRAYRQRLEPAGTAKGAGRSSATRCQQIERPPSRPDMSESGK